MVMHQLASQSDLHITLTKHAEQSLVEISLPTRMLTHEFYYRILQVYSFHSITEHVSTHL